MLLVKNYVKASPIHGLGVFLLEPVTAGAVVWRFDPMFDTEFAETFVARLPLDAAQTIYNHAEYLPERGVFRLGNDADIFMNHAEVPSLVDCGDEMIAALDLLPGDELTCNYGQVLVVSFPQTAPLLQAEP